MLLDGIGAHSDFARQMYTPYFLDSRPNRFQESYHHGCAHFCDTDDAAMGSHAWRCFWRHKPECRTLQVTQLSLNHLNTHMTRLQHLAQGMPML